MDREPIDWLVVLSRIHISYHNAPPKRTIRIVANVVLEYIELGICCILKQLLGIKISGLWFKQFQRKKMPLRTHM